MVNETAVKNETHTATLMGRDRQLQLREWEWGLALVLVGLYAPQRRGWNYFRHGTRQLNDATAQQFADDVQLCLDRIPDEEYPEEEILSFPACCCGSRWKKVLHDVIAIARDGSFTWVRID